MMEILMPRKNTGKSLTDSSYKELLDLLPAAIAYINKDLTYGYVNPSYAKLFATPQQEIIGRSVSEIISPEIYSQVEKYIMVALHGETTSFTISINANGDQQFLEVTFIPDTDDEGLVQGYTSFTVHATAATQDLILRNEELRKSEERYHKMVEEVQEYAIILLDTEGNILNWNKGAEKIKGYTAKEALGMNFRVFYMPSDREKKLPESLIEEAIKNGKASHEGWRVKKNGSTFWGSIVITALHDNENNVIGFSKVTRDLTQKKIADDTQLQLTEELKRSVESLRRSEERYQQMIEEVQDYAILLLDKDGNIQNWNKGAEKIKGYKASEAIGKNFRMFYLPQDVQSKLPERLINEAVENGRALHEGWRVKKDGTTFWGSIVITALHDSNNNIIGFSKVTRDLTERKIAEANQVILTQELQSSNERLRRSEERYHKMIEEVQDYAILLLDKDGYILNWNKGAEKIKGYKPKEIIGKHFSVFYTEEDKQLGLPGKLLNEAKTQGRAILEGWRLRNDGSMFWGSVVITALHDANNEIIGFSKVTRDLTERKIAEDMLKENAEQLQMQNKELEQFAYVASHDLQEPLRKIRTFNSLILEHEQNLSPKGKEYFDRTTAAADRMHKLIDDLLAYSRATRDTNKNELVDLNQVVAQVINSYKDPGDKKVSFQTDKLPVINGMKFQFEQLFDNLISNAVKYQEPGNQPLVKITYEKVPGSKIPGKGLGGATHYHQIAIMDNGIGFEEEYAERIFEMFHRLHGKSEFSGSGIGLAICKKIVQNYNGFITAEGHPGKGSTFNIFLPV